MTDALAALRAAVPDGVVDDPDLMAGYLTDWTGRWTGHAVAVARPRTVAEVAAVLAACAGAGARVVVQGGNTGLVGGSVPAAGEVVLSLLGLNAVESVDPVTATALVQAGATLADLQAAARPHGLELAVDLAPRDSATLGGMAATNAGGIRAFSAGSFRSHVLAVEALDATGRQLCSLRPLVKDNTGYAVGALLVGSEGTLGVITRLLVRLSPLAADRAVALLGLPDLGAVQSTVAALRARLPGLRAAEVVSAATLEAVLAHAGLPAPVKPAPWVLLVENAGESGRLDGLADALEALPDLDPEAVTVADDPAGVRRLWEYRERATEAVNAAGTPHKLDVTLPTAALAGFVDRLTGVVADLGGLTLHLWGHVGDGNLHVNLLGAAPDDERPDAAVLNLVAELGGSISAEHGIGRAKAPYLPLSRTADEIAVMRAIKRALDPDDRLGVPILPPA